MNLRIFPPDGLPEATVDLPASKSIANRALIINALAGHTLNLSDEAVCSDIHAVGRGLADIRQGKPEINVGNAGTAMRFLTALAAATAGVATTIDGDERMRRRPIGPLVDALRQCGGEIEYLGEEGFPPLKITGRELAGGTVKVDASISSQFISALMMVAPTMTTDLTIECCGEMVSRPYAILTQKMMQQAGAEVEIDSSDTIRIKRGGYLPTHFEIERDWSAAAFWYEMIAASSGFATLKGLTDSHLQGDSRLQSIFNDLGVATEYTDEGAELCASPDQMPKLYINLADNPDLALPIAVTCALIGVTFRLSGLATLRHKECDRLEAIIAELQKIGVETSVESSIESPVILVWEGARHPIFELPVFETYGDHRMAMALAHVAIYIPGIIIRDAEVVEKSYPGYWDELRKAGFTIVDGDEPLPENPEEE